jgi:hypothetical protein
MALSKTLIPGPVLFLPQFSVLYSILNIIDIQIMNYHSLKIVLAHVLKIPGVGLTSDTA